MQNGNYRGCDLNISPIRVATNQIFTSHWQKEFKTKSVCFFNSRPNCRISVLCVVQVQSHLKNQDSRADTHVQNVYKTLLLKVAKKQD